MVEFKDAFSLFDQVGDGKVEKAQVPNILRSVGLNPTKHDVERVMETLKSRKDKRIEFEVFLSVYVSLAKKQTGSPEEFIQALRNFDRDLNGKISAAELRRMLTALGDRLTEEQANAIVGLYDKKGYVDYEKLVYEVMSNNPAN